MHNRTKTEEDGIGRGSSESLASARLQLAGLTKANSSPFYIKARSLFLNTIFEARCRRQRQPQALCTTYPKSILARLPPGYQLQLPGPPHRAAHRLSSFILASLLQALGTQDTDILLAEHLAVSRQPRRHGGNRITNLEMALPPLAFGQSGYGLQNGEPGRAVGTCTSTLIPGQTITYLASFTNGVQSTTLSVQSSTWINAIQFKGWNVATPTSSGPLASSTSNPPSITSTPQSCSGLSPGAKGGIGVSAAIGGIGIIALIWAFFLLRRRPKVTQYSAVQPVQAGSKHVHELGAQQKPAELPSVR
ncbi:hypothetical protein B0J14DRAFT_662109 [Halenospora varia]|nr:hypothetical protein B0J14DRAFT_662109 [Halenospora varia]